MILPKEIKSERKKRKLTQIKAARQMDISLASLRNAEQGAYMGEEVATKIRRWMRIEEAEDTNEKIKSQ